MPLFNYYCANCSQHFESLVRSPEDEPSECPHCKSGPVTKEIAAPGGYHINGNNSASVRPKGAGHRGKK